MSKRNTADPVNRYSFHADDIDQRWPAGEIYLFCTTKQQRVTIVNVIISDKKETTVSVAQ